MSTLPVQGARDHLPLEKRAMTGSTENAAKGLMRVSSSGEVPA
jgi:hypothetical protein